MKAFCILEKESIVRTHGNSNNLYFQNASEYFSQYLKNTDGLLRLHAYWARLELNLHKDLQAARGVWESLLKIWSGHSGIPKSGLLPWHDCC